MRLGSPYRREEFRDNFGRDRSGYLVEVDGRHCFLKINADPEDAENDRLGYVLSRGLCNVPEVVIPSAEMMKELARLAFPPEWGDPRSAGTHLVRLCRDYAGTTMAASSLTAAIAAELVFSLWVHRRDAHNYNRVYNDGVPMFFDFGVAFDKEPNELFRPWYGPGYIPNWRLVKVPQGWTTATLAIRRREDCLALALQPVTGFVGFWRHAERTLKAIRALDEQMIAGAVTQCVANEDRRTRLTAFLRSSSQRLGDDLVQLRMVMGSLPEADLADRPAVPDAVA